VSHRICAKSRRSIDSNQICYFFRTELVSNNVFAEIVSERRSKYLKFKYRLHFFKFFL
jgi:hypothetical protein